MKYRIRPGRKSDAKIIFSLIRELAKFEKLAHEVKSHPQQLKKTLFSRNPVAHTLILETQEGQKFKPVGFALYFFNFSTFLGQPGLYLEDLFVLPEYRSQGFGLALLSKLAEIATKKKCGRMEWAVLDWNEGAIRFYRRLGAVPLSDWTIFRLTGKSLKNLGSKK